MNNQEAYKIFLERLIKHATTPLPRHFGKSLMKKPLHFEFEILKDFSVSKQSGLFNAKIMVNSMDEKFMINCLITRITLHKGHLRIVYYDTSGHRYLDVILEHLVDMQEYRPRDGTNLLIKNEKLVIESRKNKPSK